ncbi:MAG: tetratricopeptide repeat protein, partial [Thermoflexales bacterium]|nr:tetratricopeptide repeat protein [Thermoflexales bacterium]
ELVEAELVEGVSVPELAELELAEVEAPLPWEAELVEAELAPVEGVSVPELAELEAPLPWEAELVEAELAPVEGVSVPELAELELEAVYRALPAAEGEYEGPEPTGSQPGPEWWYQIASDEEEHVEEEAPGEAAPAAAEAPVAQVTEEVAPPAQAPPVKRPPRPAQPARPKVTPQRPSAPVFDLQGIMDRLRADPNDHGALLDLGRGWVQQGNLEGAAEAYGELVKNANLLDDVMDDLEMATESHPGTPALWQLLGDAYMKAGHLQKALKIYRQALKRI